MPPPPPPPNVYPCLDWFTTCDKSGAESLIVAGHMSEDESKLEVYVYDGEHNQLYLHHDIIQSDYPCCVRWVGQSMGQHSTNNIAAVGYMRPDIYLWNLDTVDKCLEPVEILSGHTDAVIDISQNNHMKNIMASGSADKHVRLWNLEQCISISNIKLPGKVSALEFGNHAQFLLLAGDLHRNVSLIDTRTQLATHRWQLMGEVERVRWVPYDETKFLVSDDQGYIYHFDIRQASNNNNCHPNNNYRNQVLHKFRAHQISVTGLEFSPKCNDMLVTASADETVKVWDTRTAFSGPRENDCIEPVLIKEVVDLNVGSVLSLKMCPNSLATIAVGGDARNNSFRTYDIGVTILAH